MIFDEPVKFEEAIQSAELKSILPTSLNSEWLQRLRPQWRERARFSARMANVDFLQRMDDLILKILTPVTVERSPGEFVVEGMDYAEARLELKRTLESIEYKAPPGKEGTIEDISSDQRLNLIIDHNVKSAQNYGYWQQGQDPILLDEWPAQELYREEFREEPRNWRDRWTQAASASGDKIAASVWRRTGRFIARKDSGIWRALSRFGTPYPPFDFNSGMGIKDVDRDEAERLGVIKPSETVTPQDRGFNQDLKMSTEVRSEALKKAIIDDSNETGIGFNGDVLTFKAA